MGQYCNNTEKDTTGAIFPVLKSLTSNEASIQVDSVTFQLIHAASGNSCSYITPDHDDVIKWKRFSALLALCAGKSPVTVEFPTKGQLPVFSLMCNLNKRLSKQSWGWWFETSSRPWWRHCNGCVMFNSIQNHSLGIAGWNVRWNLACAGPYLQVLSIEAEYIAISEHGLYPCEMNKLNESIPGYRALAKASRQLKDEDFGHKRGYGGCAILWSEKLSNRVRPMPNLGSDRICVLQVTTSECNIYVIAVYMPHKGCNIAEFKDEMECLERVCNECNSNGHTVVIGDMNAHLGAEHGGRFWGQTSGNGKMLVQTMYRCGMSIIDTGVKCSGPVYTFTSTTDQSNIDHCAVSNGLLPFISECQVMPEH